MDFITTETMPKLKWQCALYAFFVDRSVFTRFFCLEYHCFVVLIQILFYYESNAKYHALKYCVMEIVLAEVSQLGVSK